MWFVFGQWPVRMFMNVKSRTFIIYVLTILLSTSPALCAEKAVSPEPGAAISPVETKSARQSAPPALIMTIDVSQSPEMAEWAAKAKERCEKNYVMIIEQLDAPGFIPPNDVKLVFVNDKGVASTSGKTIRCCTAYFKTHPDDYGAVIHELCHVVQNYGRKPVPGWVSEGIADYVRWFKYEEPNRHPRIRNFAKAKYSDSYQTTAVFFDWIVRTKDKTFIKRLNEKARNGEYKAELFEQYAGKPLNDLWTEFVESGQKKQAAGDK